MKGNSAGLEVPKGEERQLRARGYEEVNETAKDPAPDL